MILNARDTESGAMNHGLLVPAVHALRAVLAGGSLAASLAAHAQSESSEPASPAPAASAPRAADPAASSPRARAPRAASAPTSAPTAQLERVEVTGGRADETEQRRQSTAAKIIIGRDEIERFGDSTVGEVLKRLPGVTMQGAPGRGGNIRMRGLGGGYTQILLDGERVPPGFSLDSLTPEQIERIEVLRAPTAETGARAIAGTINIITREGFRKRLNDVRVGVQLENGRLSPGLSWTRNEPIGAWTVNVSLSAYRGLRDNDSTTETTRQATTDPAPTMARSEHSTSEDSRQGIHLTSRLQWRGDKGESLTFTPFLIVNSGKGTRQSQITTSIDDPSRPVGYDHTTGSGDNDFTLMRLNAQWNHSLSPATRLEWRAGIGRAHSRNRSTRDEFDAGAVDSKRRLDDDADVHDDSGNLSLKWLTQLGNEHSLVAGAETEGTRRDELRTTFQSTPGGGTVPLYDDLGDNFRASTSRIALYAQDEWNVNPQWAAHAGIRWEGIDTRSDAGGAGAGGGPVHHRSSVVTPIAHAVWKPEPDSRDQVRLSLTRSYKSPTLNNLIGRPSVSSRFPVDGPINDATSPDRVGNAELKPELASGIDIALEHYVKGGGLVSANVFRRQISNLIRTLTAIETPWWANGNPRYVARPQNIGDAVTQGLELEAKFRASDVWADAIPVDVRANASFFRSRVKTVPGPDNRLDQQPSATANFGFDYRFRGTPLTIGGNYNWNPAYDTRLSEDQFAYQGAKRVVDAYALWVFNPALQVRVSGSNLSALDYVTGTTIAPETATTTAKSYVNWQVRLEMKL